MCTLIKHVHHSFDVEMLDNSHLLLLINEKKLDQFYIMNNIIRMWFYAYPCFIYLHTVSVKQD